MEIPSSFRGKKSESDKKLEELLTRTEKDLPGGLNEELTDKVCKYLDVSPYGLFYKREREMIASEVEMLNDRNFKALKELYDQIDQFEKVLEKSNIGWRLLSDEYTKEAYKQHAKEVAKIIARSPVIGYSALVNYFPVKVASYLIKKGEIPRSLFPSGLEILGGVSYFTLMMGEVLAVSLTTKFGAPFFLSYLFSTFCHALWHMDYNWENFEYYRGLMQDYRKIRKNKKLVDSLRKEKDDIINTIKDHIHFEKIVFFKS